MSPFVRSLLFRTLFRSVNRDRNEEGGLGAHQAEGECQERSNRAKTKESVGHRRFGKPRSRVHRLRRGQELELDLCVNTSR